MFRRRTRAKSNTRGRRRRRSRRRLRVAYCANAADARAKEPRSGKLLVHAVVAAVDPERGAVQGAAAEGVVENAECEQPWHPALLRSRQAPAVP